MGNIADKIKTAQDKDGMLRRALERIIQLYTDKSHFIYELLQNAEDAEAKSIRFVQYPDRLEVFHDGRPFTSANLEGLCDIGKSDKIDNLNQIGEFGVGFKSVFGICDRVRLYSDPSHFRVSYESDAVPFAVEILDFTSPNDIPEEPLPNEYTTKFVFPYVVGQSFSGFETLEKMRRTLSHKLQNLGVTTLLFMKNLESIDYQIKMGDEIFAGQYSLKKTIINDHCVIVSALGAKTGHENDEKLDERIFYLKFSRAIEKFPQRTVDIAFPIKIEEDDSFQCVKATSPYVSVYFPTETESKLNFIIQGPYRTTPNRSSIPIDDEDNRLLANETAILLRQSLLELKDAGKLNMSFVNALPLPDNQIISYESSPHRLYAPSNINILFLPLYTTVRKIFSLEAIIPSNSSKYVYAQYCRIARQDKLVSVFSDKLLSDLIGDGNQYYWLSTALTQTNREYRQVYDFFVGVLKIPVIPPEDLRRYFDCNPNFLPSQSNDWLVELYGIFENIKAAFLRDGNMTTAKVIKTSRGIFVAPFRREGKTYIPNVFLPSPKIHSADIHFVDQVLYEKCRPFFDDVLHLKKVDEYEFLIKDIKKRYKDGYIPSDLQHIEDIKTILKYIQYEDYHEEVSHVIKDVMTVRCVDGVMKNPSSSRIFVPITSEGLCIEAYYRNITQDVYFVDLDFYSLHNIDEQKLVLLGVKKSLLVGQEVTSGFYGVGVGVHGKSSWWQTTGDFRWKLSCDALKEVLQYISAHPTAKDTTLKSQTIMKILVCNEPYLCGRVLVGGSVGNLENEPCEMIKILSGERMVNGWDGKWLFTLSNELVSPKSISKHDLNPHIYGEIKSESILFSLLGFKKTEEDELDDLKKTVSKDKLDAFFESEIKRRYGISSADLDARYGSAENHDEIEEETVLPFPKFNVKSWDALKKHAAEMLIYADPVRYEAKIRSIRVSHHPREAKAYLQNMYRHDGANRFKFSCQLCHEVCTSFEATEIFLKPETELDPMNLCLCPNCAVEYRKLRGNSNTSEKLSKQIILKRDEEIQEEDYVAIQLDGGQELWFTQTHFAEIRELIQLTEEIKGNHISTAVVSKDDESEKSGLSVYSEYLGKVLRRKDGFVGVVKEVTDTYLIVDVNAGEKAGMETKIQLSFVIGHPNIYSVSEE